MTDDQVPAFDAARLIADLRANKPEAVEQAFRHTFGNDMGRLVLALHLAACGVGRPFAPQGLSDADLRYAVGRHDAALDLAVMAGFDQSSVIVQLSTDELQGATHDPVYAYTPPDDDDFR